MRSFQYVQKQLIQRDMSGGTLHINDFLFLKNNLMIIDMETFAGI